MLNIATALPLPPQISLQFQQYPPKPQDSLIELIVDKRTTIRQCLDQLIIAVGLGSELAETLCLQANYPFLSEPQPQCHAYPHYHTSSLYHTPHYQPPLTLPPSFIGDAFHLRKSNWCGEATEVIEDEVSSSRVCSLLVLYRRACLPSHPTPSSPHFHLTPFHLTPLPPHPTLISPHSTHTLPHQEETVEEQRLQPGDLLFIEEGKLPPKVTTPTWRP